MKHNSLALISNAYEIVEQIKCDMLICYSCTRVIALNFFHRIWSDNRLFQLINTEFIFYIIYTSDEDWILCAINFFTSLDHRKPSYIFLYLNRDISCYFGLCIYKKCFKLSICCEENYAISLGLQMNDPVLFRQYSLNLPTDILII